MTLPGSAISTLLLLLLLVAPAAGTTILTLEDPVGDHRHEPTGLSDPNGMYAQTDLLALEVAEDPDGFLFRLKTGQSPDGHRPAYDFVYHYTTFRHGTVAYRLLLTEVSVAGAFSSSWSGWLEQRGAPAESWKRVDSLSVTGLPGGAEVFVARDLLSDQNGVIPYPGSRLEDLFVTSRSGGIITFNGGPVWTDRMPDAGQAEAVVRFGVLQEGSLRLATDERLYASNGAATTYLWRINATNLADLPDDATLTLSGVPDRFQVRLPFDRLPLPANGTVTFPVLATVPFAHQHGVTERFILEMRSLHDPGSVGRIELGVEYLATPQPAGHHDTVYFHHRPDPFIFIGLGPGGMGLQEYAFMHFNTLPDDPRAIDMDAPGRWMDGFLEGQRFGWVIRLDPALRLGVHVDTQSLGSLEVEVHSPLPLEDARLEAMLFTVPRSGYATDPGAYDDRAGITVLAESLPGTGVGFSAGQTRFLQVDLQGVARDVVERRDDAHMALRIVLHGTGVPPALGTDMVPSLLPGGSMRMPLHEYHDPVDTSFAAPDFLALRVQGAPERFVAPGGTLLYNLTLHNGGTAEGMFRATVVGDNAAWARLPAGDRVRVPANGTAPIAVAVVAPADAMQGERADLILEAVNEADPRMRGLVRLVVVVDGERAAMQDDTAAVAALEEGNRKRSPAPGPVLAFGLLLLGGGLRRLQEGRGSGRNR